jgi:hypothetical protein
MKTCAIVLPASSVPATASQRPSRDIAVIMPSRPGGSPAALVAGAGGSGSSYDW